MKALLALMLAFAPLNNLAHARATSNGSQPKVIVTPIPVQTPQGAALTLQICKLDGSSVDGGTYLISDLEARGRKLRGEEAQESSSGVTRDAVFLAGGIVVAGAVIMAIAGVAVFFALGAGLVAPMSMGTIAFIDGVVAVGGFLSSITGAIITTVGVIAASITGAKMINKAPGLGRQALALELSVKSPNRPNAAVTAEELEGALEGLQPVEGTSSILFP